MSILQKPYNYRYTYQYNPKTQFTDIANGHNMKHEKITDPKSLQFAAGTFVIASFGKEGFSIAPNPVIHSTAESARTECARLSKLNVNKAFVYLRISGGEFVEAQPTRVSF